MKHMIFIAIAVAAGAASVSGCGEPGSMEQGAGAANAMPDMPAMATPDVDGEHVGRGTVNAIDLESGTIDISHDPSRASPGLR